MSFWKRVLRHLRVLNTRPAAGYLIQLSRIPVLRIYSLQHYGKLYAQVLSLQLRITFISLRYATLITDPFKHPFDLFILLSHQLVLHYTP